MRIILPTNILSTRTPRRRKAERNPRIGRGTREGQLGCERLRGDLIAEETVEDEELCVLVAVGGRRTGWGGCRCDERWEGDKGEYGTHNCK